MKNLLALLLSLALISCGGGSNSNQKDVEISCADVYNTGDNSTCKSQVASFALSGLVVGATTNIDAGNISRGTLINATLQAVNPLNSDVMIYAELVFNAGCAGSLTWEIMSKQLFTIKAGQTFNLTVGGECGDMPLGQHILTAKVWESDGITEIGTVNVSFNLVP